MIPLSSTQWGKQLINKTLKSDQYSLSAHTESQGIGFSVETEKVRLGSAAGLSCFRGEETKRGDKGRGDEERR